jgi:hypothetical protein
MELKLMGAREREYRGHVLGARGHKLAFELVVHSIAEGERPPSFVDVQGGERVRIESFPSAHEGSPLVEAREPDGEVPEGFLRVRLMRRGDVLFYPFLAVPEAPDWAFWRQLEFLVRANASSRTYSSALIGRRAILLAMTALLVSGVLFALRLVPIAMRLAPTNSNLLLALLLQGAPAAVVGGILFGALKDSVSRLREGELSVLGMQRPRTMLGIAGIVTATSFILPLYCWEIVNRTRSTIKANWSTFESVDFPSSSWVSTAFAPRPDASAMPRLFADYATRYCGVACPPGREVLDAACRIPASEKACTAERAGASYELFCRTPLWNYGEKLVPKEHTSEDAAGAIIHTDPDTCAPLQPAEAEATIEQTDLQLLWSETDAPVKARVQEYVGKAPVPTSSAQAKSSKAVPDKRAKPRAMKIHVAAIEPNSSSQIRITATPRDPELTRWLRQTSTLVTTQAHDYFVPVSPDTDGITLTLRDENSSAPSSGILRCTRTAKQTFGVRVVFPIGMEVRAYEQTSGGVDSRWHSPDDAAFIAMCYEKSAAPPSSGSLQITRLAVPVNETSEGTATLKFPLDQAPTHLTVFVKDVQQGEASCEHLGPPNSAAPSQPWVWFENKRRDSETSLNSKPSLRSLWNAVDATKKSVPWFCSSRDGEELKPRDPQHGAAAVVAPGAGACCFSAGHMSLMNCQEPGWSCRPKRFESALDDWLKGKGCNGAAVKECVRAAE